MTPDQKDEIRAVVLELLNEVGILPLEMRSRRYATNEVADRFEMPIADSVIVGETGPDIERFTGEAAQPRSPKSAPDGPHHAG